MRISDWSSDVCSSDLLDLAHHRVDAGAEMARHALRLAHDLPALVERAGQILRADDDHRDDDDHQKFRRIDAKHACLPPRPTENQDLVFSYFAVGASCSGTRWPDRKSGG